MKSVQTLTLEATDGVTTLSDNVTMDLKDWPLQLVSPVDSSEQFKGIYPEFRFSSPFYKYLKIQISQTSGFGDAETVTYPNASDEWMIGTITLFIADAITTQALDDLLSASPISYWRVVARDCYGNTKATETRSFSIVPPTTLVSPANGSRFDINEGIPVFVWDSSYTQFKIQFSTMPNFEVGSNTLTFPESGGAWLNEPSITLDKKQDGEIKTLLRNTGTEKLYWRVLANDGAGNMEISKTQRVFIATN